MTYGTKVQTFSISPTISIKFPHLNNDPVVRNFKVIYHYLYPLLMRYEVHLCLSPLRFSHQSGRHDRAYTCLICWFFLPEIFFKISTTLYYETKQKIQVLVFPDGILWDSQNSVYRTPSRKTFFDIINRFSAGYGKEKEETSFEISSRVSLCGGRDSNSHRITPTTPSK